MVSFDERIIRREKVAIRAKANSTKENQAIQLNMKNHGHTILLGIAALVVLIWLMLHKTAAPIPVSADSNEDSVPGGTYPNSQPIPKVGTSQAAPINLTYNQVGDLRQQIHVANRHNSEIVEETDRSGYGEVVPMVPDASFKAGAATLASFLGKAA